MFCVLGSQYDAGGEGMPTFNIPFLGGGGSPIYRREVPNILPFIFYY